MLKLAVAFAAGFVLIFPSFARADETSESTAQKQAVDIKNAIESRASGKSWLRSAMPLELAGEKECDGSSVDDFLKGKCNKLHGFDVRPYERRNGKLPPAWGGEGSAQFVPLSPEAGGHSWHIYGDEGTTTIPPLFENGIYQRVTPNYGMPWKEVPQLTPNERPMFGPSEQKQQEPNPAAK